MRWYIGLTTVALLGCGRDAMTLSPTVYVSRDAPLDDVRAAVAAWSEAAPEVHMTVQVAEDAYVRSLAGDDAANSAIYLIPTHDTRQTGCPWSTEPVNLAAVTHRSYSTGSAVVCVDVEQRGGVRAVAHELGHALRLEHAPSGLMVNAFDGPDAPQAEDIAQLREVWALR